MNTRYVAALGVAAAAILSLGWWFRPVPKPKPPKAPDAEAQPIPPPSRRGQMRQISDFLAERAQDASDHLVYVPSSRSTGVVWSTGQVVTISADSAVVQTVSVSPVPEPVPATLAPPERFTQSGWGVVAARSSDGAPISSSGLLGGSAESTCGSVTVRKLLFNVPLDSTFAGGGVFDISGDLLGQVVRCGESWVAVTHTTIEQLLQSQTGPDAVAWHDFGVRLRPASDDERAVLRLPASGLLVVEVRRSSRAFNMGLRPGDVLLHSGDQRFDQPEDALSVGDDVTIWRGRRQITLPVTPKFSIDEPSQGATLTSVQPSSRLYNAGLRPGDRILQPRTADLNRLLARDTPLWVTFEREDRRVGVLVP